MNNDNNKIVMEKNFRGVDAKTPNQFLIQRQQELEIVANEIKLIMNNILKEIDNYVDCYCCEPFREINGETIEEKYKRMEGHYDIIYETRRRHERMVNIDEKISMNFEHSHYRRISTWKAESPGGDPPPKPVGLF